MMETTDALRDAILREALDGLDVPRGRQKSLPPWLFYDHRGSALFEKITRLPEYYLTRTERSILAERADEIIASASSPITIAELGSGAASKTGLILAAAVRRQGNVLYQPIDVSASSLDEVSATIPSSIPGVRVHPQIANYITNHYTITRPQHPESHCILALYIGSSIGNFGPGEARSILRRLREHTSHMGDGLLLGVDLAPSKTKSVEFLLAAYDDAAGVTAEFNKNILVRLNRELDADFDLSLFEHHARWNPAESRIEMHLESLADQSVHIEGHTIAFAQGETIHTENSYKFTERGLRSLLHDSGFSAPQWFHDPQHYFGVALAYPA
jgi:L-histidine Nalpha-methyltransferase